MKNNKEITGLVPPSAVDVESDILGAILIDQNSFSKVGDFLIPDVFYKKENKVIYEAIVSLFKENKPIDVVAVCEELKKKKLLEAAGGILYLSKLSQDITSTANVDYHAKIVFEKWLLRGLIIASHEIAQQAYEGSKDAFDIVEFAEQKIFQITQHSVGSYSDIKNIVVDVINELEKRIALGHNSITTGLIDLDDFNLFEKKNLIILAARPSMGKTSLAIKIGRNISTTEPVGVFSLEMGKEQLATKLLSMETGFTYNQITTGNIDVQGKRKLAEATKKVGSLNLYIDDTPAMSIVEIRSKARKLKIEKDIKFLIMDYIQLATAEGLPREQEISMISRTCKQVAKELDIPFLVLSQLNRGVESRPDKRPILSDLRESGAIEQDADVVMLIYRPEYYKIMTLENGGTTENLAIIDIAKNRNGATGELKLHFQKETANFDNMVRYENYEQIASQRYETEDIF